MIVHIEIKYNAVVSISGLNEIYKEYKNGKKRADLSPCPLNINY